LGEREGGLRGLRKDEASGFSVVKKNGENKKARGGKKTVELCRV